MRKRTSDNLGVFISAGLVVSSEHFEALLEREAGDSVDTGVVGEGIDKVPEVRRASPQTRQPALRLFEAIGQNASQSGAQRT